MLTHSCRRATLCMELLIQGICGQAQHDPGHQAPLYTGDRGLDQRQKALIEGLSETPRSSPMGSSTVWLSRNTY